MHKCFFSLVMILSMTSIAKADSWAKYVGCYAETSFNGQPHDSSAVFAYERGAVFYNVNDPQTGAPIPAINIRLRKAGTGIYSGTEMPVEISAFLDRGTYFSDANADHYRFDGQVMDIVDDGSTYGLNAPVMIHTRIDIAKIDAHSIAVSFSRNADITSHAENYSVNASAILHQVPCCDNTVSLCQVE